MHTLQGITSRAAAACLLGIALLMGPAAPAEADASSDEVRRAVVDMHDWVGSGENGLRWREFLKSAQLEGQLALGEGADPAVLEEVLEQYKRGEAGLDRPRIVRVRQALEAWIDELSLPDAAELPQLARDVKQQFRPVGAEDLEAARAELKAAAERLEQYLATGGANGSNWKKYLLWDRLDANLQPGSKPNRRALRRVYRRLTSNHEGLELPIFGEVAAAVYELAMVAGVTDTKELQQQYRRALDELATNLEAYEAEPDEEKNSLIGRWIGWLEGARQAPRLVRAVRRRYSQPNVWAQFSAPLLAKSVDGPMQETGPVSEVILGTDISGVGHTKGNISVELIPNARRAEVEFRLTGSTSTDTVGYNGPVAVYSDGLTRFTARSRAFVDREGLHSIATTCEATTENDLQGIGSSRCRRLGPLVRKIALRRICRQEATAEAIAARKAERKISRRVERDARKRLTEGNEGFAKVRLPLVRLREFPERLRFSTSRDYIHVTALQATQRQLAAPSAPPKLDDPHDVSMRVHESAINNLGAGLLAGRTMNRQDIEALMIEFLGSVPESFEAPEDEEPWTITFASSKPVTVLFDDSGYQVTIRGRRYTSGNNSYRAMNVIATYHLELTPEGIKSTRQGDLRVVRPNEAKLTASDFALRSLLRKKLASVFPEEKIYDGVELSGELSKVGKLRPAELGSDAGWLKVGLRMP